MRKIQNPTVKVYNAMQNIQNPIVRDYNTMRKIQNPTVRVYNAMQNIQNPTVRVYIAIQNIQNPIVRVYITIQNIQNPIVRVYSVNLRKFQRFAEEGEQCSVTNSSQCTSQLTKYISISPLFFAFTFPLYSQMNFPFTNS